ncbi:hypothetical protein L1987_49349 [Smallanthus sonchifolius]|uniref:Uncharacterized protein n=1 Tax=Smallanthus sonchifolius TaxID=185202 RepID=A0ACB9FUH1_9ASTR|nr:hypothetical protein L1987_49349 [Smallanthus sonchifolius]
MGFCVPIEEDNQGNQQKSGKNVLEVSDDSSDDEDVSFFTTVVTDRLRFPMQFVKTTGIEENMILKVKFENLPVSELIVGSEKNSAYKRYKLIGWH